MGALVGCHAMHSSCTLAVRFDAPPAADRPREDMTVTCMGCKVTVKHHVPIELVGALVLVFHTGHEGHHLHLTYGDESWTTPDR